MIYTISRERRSEDREQASSILATTVDRILKESGIRGLIINERILNVFKKKNFPSSDSIQEGKQAWGQISKKAYKCRNCTNTGHTIKTCSAKCSNCDFHMCCAHLVKDNGKWEQKCTI